jgi:hypothetical protein
MKKIMNVSVIAGFLLLFLLSSCGSGPKSSPPSDVVKAGINAVKNKNIEEAMKYYKKQDGTDLTKEETQKLNMLFAMATSKIESKKGLKDVTILEEKISDDGNTATVKYTMSYNDGSDEKSDATLHKFNGSWYMILGK